MPPGVSPPGTDTRHDVRGNASAEAVRRRGCVYCQSEREYPGAAVVRIAGLPGNRSHHQVEKANPMNHLQMPPLETGRLVIRPFTLDDLEDVYRIIDCDCFGNRSLADEAARRRRREWLKWNRLGYEQQAPLDHPPYGERAITLKREGRLIGVCGFVPSFGPFRRLLDRDERCTLNSPEFGLFYAVSTDHRRQGYATEAAAALIEFAFQALRVRRIIATTERNNAASLGVMQRLGMTVHTNTAPGWPEVVGCCNNPFTTV